MDNGPPTGEVTERQIKGTEGAVNRGPGGNCCSFNFQAVNRMQIFCMASDSKLPRTQALAARLTKCEFFTVMLGSERPPPPDACLASPARVFYMYTITKVGLDVHITKKFGNTSVPLRFFVLTSVPFHPLSVRS